MGLNRGLAGSGAGQKEKQTVYNPFIFLFLGISVTPKTLQASVIFLHRGESAHLEKATGAVRLHRRSAV